MTFASEQEFVSSACNYKQPMISLARAFLHLYRLNMQERTNPSRLTYLHAPQIPSSLLSLIPYPYSPTPPIPPASYSASKSPIPRLAGTLRSGTGQNFRFVCHLTNRQSAACCYSSKRTSRTTICRTISLGRRRKIFPAKCQRPYLLLPRQFLHVPNNRNHCNSYSTQREEYWSPEWIPVCQLMVTRWCLEAAKGLT